MIEDAITTRETLLLIRVLIVIKNLEFISLLMEKKLKFRERNASRAHEKCEVDNPTNAHRIHVV